MSPKAIREQLERIARSPQFAAAGRLERFLRLVVEESIAGHAASLKEYRIGVEVFDRGREFDPRIDPIVRVQASRLRAKLLEYYTGAGADDPVVIEVPKGGYAATIRDRATAPGRDTGAPASSSGSGAAAGAPAADRSRIAVLPFVNMSAEPES